LLVTVAFVCCGIALVAPSAKWIESLGDRAPVFILGVGFGFQLAVILTSPAGVYLQSDADYQWHHAAIALAAVLGGGVLSVRPWLGRFCVPLLLSVHFFLELWLIKASPNPHIDVYTFHQEAYRALSQHVNPYAITMPNIYGHTMWYADGYATGGRVLVGFLYPPLSLLLGWPAHLLGDYRYAMALAVTLSGAFLAYARPGRLGSTVAAVFLFTPRGLLVIEQGWTEPLVVFFMSMTVFCACRGPKLLFAALGLLLAVKQYAVFVLPIAPFLLGRGWSWKRVAALLGKAGAVAAVVTLPLALWNIRAFVNSVVLFQGKQPFRADALSYMTWSAQSGVPRLPQWMSFAMVVLALALALWRAPRTPAGFATGASFVFFAFFSFAKQAFCNYYFMILGCLCCAIAGLYPGPNRSRPISN
jgi:hypothetical protein